MKRRHFIGIVVAAGLLGAGALVVGQSKVPPQAIASSVTRTPELVQRAWRLPVAATFNRQIIFQSNGSRCGPAAVANAYRSLAEAPITEGKVLAGTGRCWTGVCIFGLTLDELADVARGKYEPENHCPPRFNRRTVSGAPAPLQRSDPTLYRKLSTASVYSGPASDIIRRSAAISKPRT
jgi:hypothetical protein